MPAAVESAFDIALWFVDAALETGEHLQPQKLQRLLFLAQAYYAVLHEGRPLMPAVFVADALGPIEPNVFAAFAKGRPHLESSRFLPAAAEAVLRGVWRRFGHQSADALARLIKETPAFHEARRRGHRAEIPLAAMVAAFAAADGPPSADKIVRPTVMCTQNGRPVVVKTWLPKAAARS
ncbi:MAG: hypothetical protein IPM60_17005 [Rhodospirillales bacterium]|nr:hypothetical protein [Rhodospirillales bacterium]